MEMSISTADGARPRPGPRPVPWHRSAWFESAQFALLSALLFWVTLRGAQSMSYAWQWEKVLRYLYRVVDGDFMPGPLLKGLGVTLNISWIAMILTVAIGLLAAMLRLSNSIVGRAIARIY